MKYLFKPVRFLFIVFAVLLLISCKKEEIPTISTSPITNITSTAASGGGNIIDDGGAKVTARGICWGSSTNPTTSDIRTSDGSGEGQFTSSLTDLEAGISYHVRAYATNSAGTAYGADLSFTTLGNAPECITQPASNISPTGVTLNGTINANHATATVTFEYGPTIEYGQTITAVQSPVSGNSITNVYVAITGLSEGMTYHFRVKAKNSIGSDEGEDMTFTTSGQAPEATTQLPTNVTTVTATLNGSINANHSSTVVTFEYGPTDAYGSTVTAVPSPVTGNTSTVVSADVTGLNPGMVYHFRIKAVSSLGTDYGDDVTFTTIGQVPTAITLQASNVQVTTATMNGTVNANHLPTIFSFEYGPSASYGNTASPASNQVTGSSDVSVSINLVGLTGGTTYHYRVVATNQLGTTYGGDLTFTTDETIALSTTSVSGITYNSAVVGGNITNYGGFTITSRGVCWSKNPNPTIINEHILIGSGVGSFTSQIKCLDEVTTYYVRAFATYTDGIVYGNQESFTTEPCPISFNPDLTYGTVMDIDGNCYKTIQIGDQVWMAENLKTSRYNDGYLITLIEDDNEWFNAKAGAFCYYENSSSNFNVYGALYNYYAVRSNKLCPTGWHVSTYDDWRDIIANIGGLDIGGKLKESGTIHWISPNVGAINEFGFTAIPGGSRGGFFGGIIGEMGIWWAFSGYDSEYLYDFRMYNTDSQCSGYDKNSFTFGFSVRCVKDEREP